jgi:hypothetical protein
MDGTGDHFIKEYKPDPEWQISSVFSHKQTDL